jgi:hypothetical protein
LLFFWNCKKVTYKNITLQKKIYYVKLIVSTFSMTLCVFYGINHRHLFHIYICLLSTSTPKDIFVYYLRSPPKIYLFTIYIHPQRYICLLSTSTPKDIFVYYLRPPPKIFGGGRRWNKCLWYQSINQYILQCTVCYFYTSTSTWLSTFYIS